MTTDAKRRSEPSVFLPWEKRRGMLGWLGRARVRVFVIAIAVVVTIVILRQREEHKAAVRATRATIGWTEKAVMAYRADHNGACPLALADLVTGGYMQDAPVDAWGHPLRITCPGRKDVRGFEVSSDGPDGIEGGLDRVE